MGSYIKPVSLVVLGASCLGAMEMDGEHVPLILRSWRIPISMVTGPRTECVGPGFCKLLSLQDDFRAVN